MAAHKAALQEYKIKMTALRKEIQHEVCLSMLCLCLLACLPCPG